MQRLLTSLLLLTAGCGVEGPEDLGADPAAADLAASSLVVRATPMVLGGSMDVTVTGARPGETVYVAKSLSGEGPGPCLRQLGGRCLSIRNPVSLFTIVRVDGTGSGSRTLSVSDVPTLDGMEVCYQASVVRGTGGVHSVLSGVTCTAVGYDADDDGVLDEADLCAGHPDGADADRDGIPDGCDGSGRGTVVSYPDPEYGRQVVRYTFEGRDVAQIVPRDPVGLVWAFHGSGGGEHFVDQPEVTLVLRALLDRGYGFVAVRSHDRGGVFDSTRGPAANEDWRRVDHLRDALIAAGDVDEDTPMFALGYSAGGGFASWLGHTAPSRGWPLRALVLHNASGFNRGYGELPDLPVAFVASENDDVVPLADTVAWYEAHRRSGNVGLLLRTPERALEPGRFARSPYVSERQSRAMFDALVDDGWFDAKGRRRFDGDLKAIIDEIGKDPDFVPTKPGKAVLSVVLATHAFHAAHAEAEADFLDAHR